MLTLILPIESDDNDLLTPDGEPHLEVEFTDILRARVEQLRRAVADVGAYCIEEPDYRVFRMDEETSMEHLVVTATHFWWAGTFKHTSIGWSTPMVEHPAVVGIDGVLAMRAADSSEENDT